MTGKQRLSQHATVNANYLLLFDKYYTENDAS